jgi:DNA-binding NarL/FixJ family response regulator
METTLLLVDPHVLLREGVRALLSAREELLVVGEASDGEKALAMAERLHPDLVILETHLPGISGLEVIGQLTSNPDGPRVLVLSMYDSQMHVEQALRAGACGYMVKTGSAKELLHAVEMIRDGQTYVSSAVMEQVMGSMVRNQRTPRTGVASLTPREREVLRLIAEGLSGREIAHVLDVSSKTVETHRSRIMEKLGIHKVSGLVRCAIREGLLVA